MRAVISMFVLCFIPSFGQCQDLQGFRFVVPERSQGKVKLDLLAYEIVAQMNRQSEAPFNIVIEHTILPFNLKSHVDADSWEGGYTFFVKPSPFPVLGISPGSYSVQGIVDNLKEYDIDGVYVRPYNTLHLVQMELLQSPEWPLNRELEGSPYGVADATECREILKSNGYNSGIDNSIHIAAANRLHQSMTYDFTQADSVRALVSCFAQTLARKEGRGSVIFVTTFPPTPESDYSEHAATATWVGLPFLGARALQSEHFDEPLEMTSDK